MKIRTYMFRTIRNMIRAELLRHDHPPGTDMFLEVHRDGGFFFGPMETCASIAWIPAVIVSSVYRGSPAGTSRAMAARAEEVWFFVQKGVPQ